MEGDLAAANFFAAADFLAVAGLLAGCFLPEAAAAALPPAALPRLDLGAYSSSARAQNMAGREKQSTSKRSAQ